MKNYLQLTERGKARRLRKLVDKALQHYDLEILKIRMITNHVNGIFRLDAVDGQKYVMRVVLPAKGYSIEHINSEMEFLNALSQAPDINAPVPVPTKSGSWLTTVSDQAVPEARHCIIFSWLSGVDLDKRPSLQSWEMFGKLSARLHLFASTFKPSQEFSISAFDEIFPFEGDFVLLEDENRQFFSPEDFDLLKIAIERVQSEIDQLHSDKSAICVTHGDLHQWNIQISRGKLNPIDFEDMMWAHPIQDIATTFYYTRSAENYETQLSSFKKGYATITSFPESYERQLETHILTRQLCILNDVLLYRGIQNYPDLISRTIERIRYVQEYIWRT